MRAGKNLVAVVVATLLVAVSLATAGPVGAETAVDLVPNGGLETVSPLDPSAPAAWRHDSWGNAQATFSWPTGDAHGGTHSARIDVTSSTDGGAKWSFDPQPVDANSTYLLSTWYRSDQTTELLAVYTKTDGSTGYQWLADVAPTATWTRHQSEFTTPPDVTSVTIFHSITAAGYLQTDDISLLAYTPPPPPPFLGLVPNGDMETVSPLDPSAPTAWRHDSWGNTQATFSWPTGDAHGGTHSARIDVTSSTDGGAKWSFDPQPVDANSTYLLSTWYRSDQTTELLAVYTKTDGSTGYQWLADVAPTATWTRHQSEFTTPPDVTSVTIFHSITAAGYLQTDDISLTTATPPNYLGIVPNGDVEKGALPDNSSPMMWRTSEWGANEAAFSWTAADARSGTHATRIDVTSYADGGATWSFDPQPITENSSYRYTSWYRSDATTEILVVYAMTNGSTSYQWLADVPPSSTWARFTKAFTAPDGVATVTIFQSITSVGFVETDDLSLTAIEDLPATYLGIVPNGDFEKAAILDPSVPSNWRHDSWGDNVATFSWPEGDAHSASHAARIDMTAYTSGGAKWSFDPQPVSALRNYQYSSWYRSNVPTEILAVYTKTDGSTAYQLLANPPANSNWTRQTSSFTAPAHTTTITIFQSITSVGFVETDDFSITQVNPKPFSRPLVSLTFDDGTEAHYTVAYPKLQSSGLPGTFYIITDYLNDSGPPAQLTSAQLVTMSNGGMEVGSHTLNHPHLTTRTPLQQFLQLAGSKINLETLIGKPVTSFASPYGDYNDAVLAQIKTLYSTHRTIDYGSNLPETTNLNRLKAKMVFNTTTADDVESWIDEAQLNGEWLILVFHDIYPSPDTYDVSPEVFSSLIDVVKASGVTVKSVSDAAAEVAPQLGP